MACVKICVPVLAPDSDLKSECWQIKNKKNLSSKIRWNRDKRTTYELGNQRQIRVRNRRRDPSCMRICFSWSLHRNICVNATPERPYRILRILRWNNGLHKPSQCISFLFAAPTAILILRHIWLFLESRENWSDSEVLCDVLTTKQNVDRTATMKCQPHFGYCSWQSFSRM